MRIAYSGALHLSIIVRLKALLTLSSYIISHPSDQDPAAQGTVTKCQWRSTVAGGGDARLTALRRLQEARESKEVLTRFAATTDAQRGCRRAGVARGSRQLFAGFALRLGLVC